MKVFIYWNLHRKCWSIKALSGPDKGRVKYHASAWTVTDAVFRVSEAGRQRVIREQRKNVHAGVVGDLRAWVDLDGDQGAVEAPHRPFGYSAGIVPVSYNPYKAPTFMAKDGPESFRPAVSAAVVKADGRAVSAAACRS